MLDKEREIELRQWAFSTISMDSNQSLTERIAQADILLNYILFGKDEQSKQDFIKGE